MPGRIRNKNIQYDDDDFYDDYDDYEDGYGDAFDDQPVAQPKRVTPASATPTNNRKEFFEGIEWGRVPLSRASRILEIPQRPRRQLLGGAAKPSKLQALAAQRRKAQEGKKAQEPPTADDLTAARGSNGAAGRPLDQGSLKTRSRDQEARPLEVQTLFGEEPTSPYKRQRIEANEISEPFSCDQEAPSAPEQGLEEQPQRNLRAQPSMFASALFGARSSHPRFGGRHDYRILVTGQADSNPFVGPSPDDIVSKAQSKSTVSPAQKSQPKKSNANGVTQGVATMKIADAPNIKSKNLDVPREYEQSNSRGHANFVVIGHVDHGKSTLMGRLLLDLKHPDLSERDFRKLQKGSAEAGKGSFALAWAMDSRPDEREHGVTIDIATQHFSTDNTDFTVLDAPGHRDFIKNMISGTSQADFAVLVVDASGDAFEAGFKGQTREHAMLARSLGIAKLIVAVNKMDVTKWGKERFEEIQSQLQGFFTAAGFGQKNITFVPCAGLTGENVVAPLNSEQRQLASWYDGPTLVQVLEAFEPRQRRLRDPLRMTISDVSTNVTSGMPTGDVSVTGLIDSGHLQVGTKVLIQPSGEVATVKGISTSNDVREWAVAGQIATLHLVGLEADHVSSGHVLCERNKNELQNVRIFTAKCLVFENLLPTRLALHRGQIYCSAQIRFLKLMDKSSTTTPNGGGGARKGRRPPRVAHPQQVVRVLVELYDSERGLPLDVNDRVVLREEGKTMASGIIDGIEEYVKQ